MCTHVNIFVCLGLIAIRVSSVQDGWMECAPVVSQLPLF